MAKRLFLFDYDHTLVIPEQIAYDSLKVAAVRAAGMFDKEITVEHQQTISQIPSGGTDSSRAAMIASVIGINEELVPAFQEAFYHARTDYLAENGAVYGEIYDDALCLLRKIQDVPETVLMLVTGNTREVMQTRLHPILRPFFSNDDGSFRGAFGDDASGQELNGDSISARHGLIVTAIERAESHHGFVPERDTLGFMVNGVYIGDTLSEMVAGVKAGMRVVYIPGRTRWNLDITGELDGALFYYLDLTDRERKLYLHGSTVDAQGRQKTEGWFVKPVVFGTGLLANPFLSYFLDVPIEPIYSPEKIAHQKEWESARRANKESR